MIVRSHYDNLGYFKFYKILQNLRILKISKIWVMESMPPSADDDDNIYDTPENNDFEADDVLLAEDEDFNVPGCSKSEVLSLDFYSVFSFSDFTPSLRDLFDRSKVGCGVSSTGDLEGLQLSNVHAYDAKQLESKLCEHVVFKIKSKQFLHF